MTVRAEGDRLSVREDGTLTLHTGDSLPARRAWWFLPADGALDIRFADPHRADQPYVSLAFAWQDGAWLGADTHLCAADTYAVRVRISSPVRFWMDTHIRGPKKDMHLSAEHVRLSD